MDLNEQFKVLLSQSEKKYGELGIGTLMVRLQYLTFLIKENSALTGTIDEILRKVLIQYNFERIPTASVEKYIFNKVENGEIIYSFDEQYFTEKYAKAFPLAHEGIYKITKTNIFSLKDSMWYLYVIDKNNNLIIYDAALTTTELVLNRNNLLINGVPLVHPILSYPSNLEVKAAGEITFIHSKQKLHGIIINSKSGHYRPSSNCLELAVKTLVEVFEIPTDIIFKIPVGKDVKLETYSN